MSAYMNEFVSFNVLDEDYVEEKYKGKKNNRLEDITDEEIVKTEDIIEDKVDDLKKIKEVKQEFLFENNFYKDIMTSIV